MRTKRPQKKGKKEAINCTRELTARGAGLLLYVVCPSAAADAQEVSLPMALAEGACTFPSLTHFLGWMEKGKANTKKRGIRALLIGVFDPALCTTDEKRPTKARTTRDAASPRVRETLLLLRWSVPHGSATYIGQLVG